MTKAPVLINLLINVKCYPEFATQDSYFIYNHCIIVYPFGRQLTAFAFW